MPSPRVFVSYSHRDEKALMQLRRFLGSLERMGRVDWWADTRVQEGQDWQAEIDAALAEATVAVLLVSQDFLASDFIAREELPRLLARAEEKKLTLLPVFLSPSLVDDLDLPFTHPTTGAPATTRLTRFQGFGSPDKPLSSLSYRQRENAYKKLGQRLLALARSDGGVEVVDDLPVARARTSDSSPAPPAREYRLTVQLERRGNDLQVRYHLPDRPVLASRSVPWAEASGDISVLGHDLDTANSRTLRRRLEEDPAGWGDALFNLLFGSEAQWEPVLRGLFDRPAPAPRPWPTFDGARLRIVTDDPLLAGLPWRLTTWQGQFLVDAHWVFSTSQESEPARDVLTVPPANVLLVAPQATAEGEPPRDGEHPRAVADLLQKIWPTGRDPGYLQVVSSRQQLEKALLGMKPHLLYVYSSAVLQGGRPCLLLDGAGGPEAIPLASLPALCQRAHHHPSAIYLNVSGLGASKPPTPCHLLGREVPLVVWRRLPDHTPDSTARALDWLGRWLGEGQDPVAALHRPSWEAAGNGLEAATLAVHECYRTWTTRLFRGSRRRQRPHLRLDRDHQKALVAKHLGELARSDSRRVLALVAYAPPGNRLAAFSEQLEHYLEVESADVAAIERLTLEFPASRRRLAHDLPEELKLQLGADPHEPIPYLLRRRAPRVAGGGPRPVLWLDWGVFGDGSQPLLSDEEQGEWLRFASDFLVVHCPEDLRLILSVAFRLAAGRLKSFAGGFKEHRKQPWASQRGFRLTVLPPLGQVSEEELFYFLEDRSNSTCDPVILGEVTERLIAATDGNFAALTARIEEAEQGSWYDLLARLRREQDE